MSTTDLLQWGASLHYPRIVLSREPRDILQAGEQAWITLCQSDESVRVARLQCRRERWLILSKENER